MEYLTELLADVEERIDQIQTIGDVNNDLLKVSVGNLQSLRRDLISTGRNQQIIQKIDTQLKMFRYISQIPDVSSKLPIIYEQMIVLMIGALEVYLNDIFRNISNKNPEYFVWKAEKEKISFEPSLLAEKFTLGDVIIGHLKNQGVSFQDLQSTLNAIKKYFDISVELENETRDELILAAASRNVIVHNRSAIDSSFRKQIRDTPYANLPKYQKGKRLSIEENDATHLGDTIKDFCRNLTVLLMQRDEHHE